MNDRDGGKDVRHTMEYDWRLHGSHCHLIQREAWQLRIVQPEPESTRAADKAKCATPGKTKRISVRKPNALRIQSGQTLRIQAWPVDAEGCTTKDRIVWKTNGGQISTKGELTALNVKREWLQVIARVKGVQRTLKVKVIPAEPPIGVAPRGPRYDPSLTVQDEDRLPFFGFVFNATSGPFTESVPWWDRFAGPLSLGLSGILFIVLGFRLRRKKK